MKTFDYLKKYKAKSILAFLAKVAEALLELMIPMIVARIIDYGINPGNPRAILAYGVFLFVFPLLGYLSAMVCQYLASYVGQSLGTDIRKASFKIVSKMDNSQLEEFGDSSLITRISNDTHQVQLAVATVIRLVSRVPVLLIGAVIMSFLVSPRLAPIFVVSGLLLGFILSYITILANRGFDKVQDLQDRVSQSLRENLSGIRVIRAFTNQDLEKSKFNKINDSLKDRQIGVGTVQSMAMPSSTMLVNIAVAFILYFGARLVDSGLLMQGHIVALVNYTNTILLALNQLVQTIIVFSKGFASLRRVDELLVSGSEIEGSEDKGLEGLSSPQGSSIEFNGVSFSYSSKPVLSNISFKIDPGDFVGIIGATGSGKSTIARLLSRYYDVDSGKIIVDGVNVKDYSTERLRDKIAYVPQRTVLFSGTIRENLLMGNLQATDEDIWKALEMAQADSFIKDLDKRVEESGKNFSGGQRQRLAIARAFIQNKPIILLDDSISALDFKTESLIRTELEEIDSTVILISQRISSIRLADEILVIDKGQLVGKGGHPYLLANNDVYRQIYESQNSDEVENES